MRAIAIALFAFAGLLVLLAARFGRDWTATNDGPAIPVSGLRRAASHGAIAFVVFAIALALYCAASCALGHPCFGMS